MSTLIRSIAAVATITAAGTASAQNYYQYQAPHNGVPYVGSNWGGVYRHSSTYAEGVQRGRADVIRSQGLYELLHSQALVNQEHARSLATENKTAAIKARYDRRQVAEDYATQKKLERDARVAKYTAMKESRKNATVVVDQFDAVSGQVFWPAALKSRPFENSRREIDALMAERMMMSDGVEADENLRLIRTAATKMWKELSDSSESLLPGQLTTGRGFLKNLIAQASVAHSPRANFVASR